MVLIVIYWAQPLRILTATADSHVTPSTLILDVVIVFEVL